MSLKRNDPRHGTANGYKNYACRCNRCTAAHTEYQREAWRRRGRMSLAEWLAIRRATLPPHGTESRYTHKREPCGCEDCKRASREARARRRAKVAA